MGFSIFDVFVVVVYVAISIAVGFWIGRNQKNTTDYFLGGRHIPWLAVTFSIVATETSVLTFISIPAVAYQGNLRFMQMVIGYAIGRFIVAMLMIPAYYRGDIETAYHFLGNRFGQKLRNLASISFMTTQLLGGGVRLFATAIPLAIIMKSSGLFGGLSNTQFYLISIVAMGLVTMLYTCFGGIRSVVWVDVIQMTIYIGGAILAGIIILTKLPNGLSDVTRIAGESHKFDWFYLGTDLTFKEFIKQPYTFFTAIVGGAIFSLASHGTDQLVIQRVLTCGNKRASQKAIMTTGIVVLLQFLLFLLLGLLLYSYYGGAGIADLGLARADGIFPKFIVEEMPRGISGLIVAALFAAAMSTLAGCLSSLSSSTVLDIYVPLFGKDKTPEQLLKISRCVTLVWGALLVCTAIAFIGLKGTVVETALSIASYTYGGLLGTFLLGLFHKKSTQRDAIIGFVSGLVTMIIVIQTIKIAWPLYIVVGSLTTVVIGIASCNFFGSDAKNAAEKEKAL